MNTSLSALLLWENESRYRSGTFRSYKQLVQEITEKTRAADGRNHRAPVKREAGKEKEQDPALKQTSGYKRNNSTCQNRQKIQAKGRTVVKKAVHLTNVSCARGISASKKPNPVRSCLRQQFMNPNLSAEHLIAHKHLLRFHTSKTSTYVSLYCQGQLEALASNKILVVK